MSDNKIKDLLPALIEQKDKPYTTVQELGNVLAQTLSSREIKPAGRRIKNIAITGPYGAGKSSIIQTLENDFPQFKYLNLSLATLRADETSMESGATDIEEDKSTDANEYLVAEDKFEELNRKIEYSILQQIIYKEEASAVPNSRLRRIRHFKSAELTKFGIAIITFLLCFFIVFEPEWFRVETFYSAFNLGKWNIAFDLLCSGLLLFESFLLSKKLIQAYSNSKLNKLNLKDGEIELQETSIFNKHLDEILYFFQVTEYNVVVIEDVDRFGTTDIFLKLRELNQLINESNVIGRPVIFLYAVKDDLFKDEDRVKFFDYIVTVVPTINPSNSKDKLKEHLRDKGHTNFDDNDLSEIGFFIQDMRLLINIVNEYDQYHKRLIKENANLDCTKLLGMIVYKNFYPRDFAMLHRREGLVFRFMELKDAFIIHAQDNIKNREKNIDKLIDEAKRDSHLKIEELRGLFLGELSMRLNNSPVTSFCVESTYYSLSDIAKNDNLFNNILKHKNVHYRYLYGYGTPTDSVEIDVQDVYVNTGFEKRIKALELFLNQKKYEELKQSLKFEKLSISSLRMKDFLQEYAVAELDCFKQLNLPALIEIFLREGYIDEDYYDYISYFYEGMISFSDRETLIDIKRQRKGDCLKHIDHVENFVKELKPHNFTSDSILYVELLDYLVENSVHPSDEYLSLFYKRLNRKNAPLDFLATYCKRGENVDTVFSQFIAHDPQSTWEQIQNYSEDADRQSLLCAWLRYGQYPLDENIQEWIDKNYPFIEKNAEALTDSIIDKICADAQFEKLDIGNHVLLRKIIEENSYVITSHNLAVLIANETNSADVSEERVALTEILNTHNATFIEYIQTHIKESFSVFSLSYKDENVQALQWLLNNECIENTALDEYLIDQRNQISSLKDIKQERWSLVLKNNLVEPSWSVLIDYYDYKQGLDDVSFKFVERNAVKLGSEIPSSNSNNCSVFFQAIFLNANISLTAIKLLTPVFKENVLNGEPELAELDTARIEWYLEQDMLGFNDVNTSVLKDTGIFAQYLVRHKEHFLQSIDNVPLSRPDVITYLLDNKRLTSDERTIIVNHIPESVIVSHRQIANKVIQHFSRYGSIDKSAKYYISLFNIASVNEDSIRLASRVIACDNIEISDCYQILNSLGDSYSELTDYSKKPKFEATSWNRELLESVKRRSIISSYNDYKDTWLRAFHGRK